MRQHVCSAPAPLLSPSLVGSTDCDAWNAMLRKCGCFEGSLACKQRDLLFQRETINDLVNVSAREAGLDFNGHGRGRTGRDIFWTGLEVSVPQGEKSLPLGFP